MIELPEAVTIARQIDERLKGRRIDSALRGNSPHKFAFYSGEPEDYERILAGKEVAGARARTGMILVAVEPDYTVVLGCGGEKIIYHQSEATLPKKHQLLLHFADGSYLTVSVSGWGAALLLKTAELKKHPLLAGPERPTPLDPGFTYETFRAGFDELAPDDPRAVKFFVISKPGVPGVGNGYLQDILFRARIHPRRRAAKLEEAERQALYESTCAVIREATAKNGRDTERDLFDRPGDYRRTLDSRTTGQPCPRCGTTIEKISFLGGASYFCPSCQV